MQGQGETVNEELQEFSARILIAVVAVTWLVLLLRASRDPAYDNFRLIGYIATKEGYPDRVATAEVTVLLAMTLWGTIMVLRNQMSEWFIGTYVLAFVLRGAHSAYLKAAHPATPGTTTVETSSKTETSVVAEKKEQQSG